MYTRAYFPEEEKIKVPENYVGNAFGSEEINAKKSDTPPIVAEPVSSDAEEATMKHSDSSFGGGLRNFSFSRLFDGLDIFKGGAFKNIGTEEILIIGIALFLLFSQGGDKECAIMLFLLLFIK